jgi:hypothetical protein
MRQNVYAHYHARKGLRKKRTHVRQQHVIVDALNTGTRACALPECLTTCVRWTTTSRFPRNDLSCPLLPRTEPNVFPARQSSDRRGRATQVRNKWLRTSCLLISNRADVCAQHSGRPFQLSSYPPSPVARAGPKPRGRGKGGRGRGVCVCVCLCMCQGLYPASVGTRMAGNAHA